MAERTGQHRSTQHQEATSQHHQTAFRQITMVVFTSLAQPPYPFPPPRGNQQDLAGWC